MPRRSTSPDSLSNNYNPSEPPSARGTTRDRGDQDDPDETRSRPTSWVQNSSHQQGRRPPAPSSSLQGETSSSFEMDNRDQADQTGGNGQRQRFRRSVFGQRQAAQNSNSNPTGISGQAYVNPGDQQSNPLSSSSYHDALTPTHPGFAQPARENSYDSFSLRPPALPFAAGGTPGSNGPQPSPSLNSIASSYDDKGKENPMMAGGMHQRRSVASGAGGVAMIPGSPSGSTTGSFSGSNSNHNQSSRLPRDRSAIISNRRDSKTQSLSLNYLPTKFAKLHSQGDWAHRRKRGGGRAAFADDAGRMGLDGYGEDEGEGLGNLHGSIGDSASIADRNGGGAGGPGGANGGAGRTVRFGEDARGEGVRAESHDSHRGLVGGHAKKGKKFKLRWNRFKWALFVTNILLLIISIAILIASLLVWFDVFTRSDVIRTGNRVELIISTAAGALCLLTALIGLAGIILNNRAFLAVYSLFLWFCFMLIVVPGYLTYKKRTFNLEGKINAQWSTGLGLAGRLRLQNQLDCCGYYSPFSEATASNTCYARSNLPGCKTAFLKHERSILETWYICSFVLVPVIIGIIVTALLSSNHVTYRFGKGLTPKRYRLDDLSMAVIMDEYASEIAEQFGQGIAQEALNRSSSYGDLNEKNHAGSIDPRSRSSSFVSYK